jgi:hypothetical protein
VPGSDAVVPTPLMVDGGDDGGGAGVVVSVV